MKQHLASRDLTRASNQAVGLAKAVAAMNRTPRILAPVLAQRKSYSSPCKINPFSVPLSKKLDLLLSANEALCGPKTVRRTSSYMDFHQKHKYFISTEGADLEQRLTESGAGLEVIMQADGEVQTRSFPNSHHGALAQAGYEYVESLDLVRGAATARREAAALLRARPPRSGAATIVLHPTQVAMQLHESCGHPAELDRALGHELSYAGGSFLTPDQLGQKRYGSPAVTIVADATVPGGVGSMAFDDEGVPRKVTPLIEDGVLKNFTYDLDTAGRAGTHPSGHGTARSFTNLVINPGDTPFEKMVKGVKEGLLVHEFLGLGQGNPINGEFSVNVFLGYSLS